MSETPLEDISEPKKRRPKWLYYSLLLNLILILILIISYFWVKSTTMSRVKTYFSRYYERKVEHFETLPNEKGDIIFVGNSITDGANWAEIFQNPKIKNRGVDADVSAGILGRFSEVVEGKPSKIFLMIGTNDLDRGVDIDEIIENIKQILTKIKVETPQTKVYLQSILPIRPSKWTGKRKNKDIEFLNKKLEVLAGKFGTTYIDLHSAMLEDGKLKEGYTNDGLHLTGKGYEKWKAMIQKYIQEKIKKETKPKSEKKTKK